MSPTMTYSQTLVVTSCWCGIPFAIPENLHDWMHLKKGNSCRCPNGHTMIYNGTLEEQLEETRAQLRRTREREQATKDLLDQEERSHAATRGHLTRAKKQVHRAEHGVCPHCNRSFQNLARHMQSKHPREVEPGT